MLRVSLLIALMLTAPAFSLGQAQPPVAENNQDEVVTIDAPPADDEGVLRIFRSGDKGEINHYVSHVVELEQAIAMELLPHVKRAVRLEKGDTRVLRYKVDREDESTWRYFIQIVTTERQMPSVIETIKALDKPGITSDPGDTGYSIRMRYRRASDMAEIALRTNLSGEGKVFADDLTNTLYMEDSLSDNEGNLAIVDFYDVPPMQVEMEIKIIEINDNDAGQVGLDWDAWKRSLSGDVLINLNWVEGSNVPNSLLALLTLDAQTLSQFLNYTVQTGSARLVNRAKMTATNLSPATIAYSRPAGGRYESLHVKVQPLIGTEAVSAAVEIKASKRLGVDEENNPILEEQAFDSVVTLTDHQPLNLGSINRSEKVEFRRGIPGLRDIPVLKYLFSVKGHREESSKLFIIATPCFCNSVEYPKRLRHDEGEIMLQREGAPHHGHTSAAK